MKQLLTHEIGRLSPEEFEQEIRHPFVVVLDNIRSGHNVGAAFRTADAFAIDGIYLCGITPSPPHKEIHKTALGATNTVLWEKHSSTLEGLKKLKEEGYLIVAVEITDQPVYLQDFSPKKDQKYAFVFGNEMKGVQQEVLEVSDFALEVPQFGTKHSLNISVSLGIVLWQSILKTKFT